MASVSMDFVQLWRPPNVLAHDPPFALPKEGYRSNFMTGQPILQHTDAHQLLSHDSQRGPAITLTRCSQHEIRCQAEGHAEEAQDCDLDEFDNYFPSVEELVYSITRGETVMAEEYESIENDLSGVEEPNFEPSSRNHGSAQKDNATSDEKGTQDRPLIIKDDDDDSSDFEDASPTDNDLRASSQDTTLSSTSDERAFALDVSTKDRPDFDTNNSIEANAILEDGSEPPMVLDAQLPTLLFQYQNNQQYHKEPSSSASEQIQPTTPVINLKKRPLHEREQIQIQRKAKSLGIGVVDKKEIPPVQVLAGDDDSAEERCAAEMVERRLIQQQDVVEVAQSRSCINAVEDNNSGTSDEDDASPRPAKQQRRFSTIRRMVRTASRDSYDRDPTPSLRQPSYQSPPTQIEASVAHAHNAHSRPRSSADDSRLLSRGNSQSPSSAATDSMSIATVAKYHEWALQIGSVKRTMIGDDILIQIQFNHKDLHDLLALQSPDDRSRERASARSTRSHRLTNHIKKMGPARRRGGKHSAFTSEDGEHLIDLKENQRLRWKEIVEEFPRRSIGSLQVRYCTKLKNRCLGSLDGSDVEE